MSGKVINVGFIGNPNCGKTTLFNAYTGANLKVANWPGVTVEKKEGRTTYKGQEFKLIDLPGIYSLTSYTMEEKVSRECIMSDEVDVIVDVVDASCLERNLYLTLQLIELGKPVVLALNMMDIVEERGMEIDLHRLPEMLGIPAIPVSARKRTGLEILLHAVAHHQEYAKQGPFIHHHSDQTEHKHNHHSEYAMVYADEIEDKIDAIIEQFREKYPEMDNMRWHAIKTLEQDDTVMKKYPVDMTGIADRSYEKDIINEKYDFIEEVIDETLVNKSAKAEQTDRIDRFMTSRWLGLPIFLVIMALVFFLTFTVGDWLKGYFETGLDLLTGAVSAGLEAAGTSPMLNSLLVDGIISGVGGILTFLPNIFILFLALAFLEDSGYMSRVAFVMDDIMSHLGLSGRAFLPMLLGFGCSVPAVMASRALEHRKDRLKTILVTPFMSCSARLPIYVLFSSMFFGEHAMLACYSMYLLGIVLFLLGALLVKRITGQKFRKSFFIIELPEYKVPSLKRAVVAMLERGKAYIVKAGTIILVCNTVVQIMQTFNWQFQLVEEGAEGTSILASIAHPFAILFIPLGFGVWQLAAAAITGFIAKENVVGTLAVVYGVTNLIDTDELALVGSGSEVASVMALTKVAALAYLMFNLYTPPCFAALGAMNSEMKSGKWLLGGICLQLATGYTVAFLVYQIGTLITTGSLGTAFVPGLIAVLVFAVIILWRVHKSDQEFVAQYSLHSSQS